MKNLKVTLKEAIMDRITSVVDQAVLPVRHGEIYPRIPDVQIVSDRYVLDESLQEGRPLLLFQNCHENCWAVIPNNDFAEMEEGVITPEEYIQNSRWSVGYFAGKWDLIDGIYWEPLKDRGISYSNYVLGCYTKVDGFYELKNKVKERFIQYYGLKVSDFSSHNKRTLGFYPDFRKGEITVYLPKKLLSDMLYHPKKYLGKIEEVVESLEIEVIIHLNRDFPLHSYVIPENYRKEELEILLRNNSDVVKKFWFPEIPKKSIWARLRNLF